MTSQSRRNLFQWMLGIGILGLLILLAAVTYLSRLSDYDHKNLRYLMWKAGLRDYTATVALSGMTHDHGFRESLRSISIAEFHTKFPSTFKPFPTPSQFGSNSRFLVENPSNPVSHHDGLPEGWVAHFKGGKLHALDCHKIGP